MSDLMERLRAGLDEVYWEAADEIDGLRSGLLILEAGIKKLEDEIERLRKALEERELVANAEVMRLREALELFIQTVNPPYPQSMAVWQEHLKAATANARKALDGTGYL